jgi:3-phosphoshikimate 1-carboxyvinyltransferase
VSCEIDRGVPPIKIKGPLTPQDIEIDGSLSSQFLTGLLMAYGAAAENKVISVRNLKSKPYVDLTLQLMHHFGVKVRNENFNKFYFDQKQHFRACSYTVEGDWSGAAFLLVAGAVAGQAEVENLNVKSAQSDKAILTALRRAGANVMEGMFTVLTERAALNAFEMDATDCPDLFPPLVALAANCKGKTKIKGVSRLAHKESDRGKTLQEEFAKMDVRIDLNDDDMVVHGGAGIRGAEVFSHHDHRIAMACATAALTADRPVKISGAEAVNKSYPEFWHHWQKLGGRVQAIALTGKEK